MSSAATRWGWAHVQPGVTVGQVAGAGRRVAVDARAPVQAQFDGGHSSTPWLSRRAMISQYRSSISTPIA